MSSLRRRISSVESSPITIMTPDNASSGNVFKVANVDEDYWTTYLAARPKYSPDFYNLIYDYHSLHGNTSWGLAHDVGTGPGQVAVTLADRFEHVIASDNNASHLAIAQHRISALNSSKRITIMEASGEDIATKCPPGSTDLIAAAECVPLMDPVAAVAGFASLLRTGGTLAMWFYGRPIFAEEAFHPSCQPIYDKIANKAFSKVLNGGGPEWTAAWQRVVTMMVSWLDNVALPGEQWAHVKRYKWNPDERMSFFDKSAYWDFEVERTSRIGAGEEVLGKKHSTFWGEKWTLEDVRTFFKVNLPYFKDNEADVETEGWYKELGEAMGGQGAVRAITWPVVLILATKK